MVYLMSPKELDNMYHGMICSMNEGFPFYWGCLKMTYYRYSKHITRKRDNVVAVRFEFSKIMDYDETNYFESLYEMLKIMQGFVSANIDLYEVMIPMCESQIIYPKTMELDFINMLKCKGYDTKEIEDICGI